MKTLVTGAAGFIGFHVVKKLIENGIKVVGVDNINSYYDQKLKLNRIKELKNNTYSKNFVFKKIDITDYKKLSLIFKKNRFTKVINLAAQAGVRYSIENPKNYIDINIVGFFNVIDLSKKYKIKNFVYASSSSVYGANKNFPFLEKKIADHPIQLYAVTKRTNELISHAYSSLYNLPTTGLRFFTAYGPWGRPDQALFIFTKKILKNQSIELFNHGNHSRDFTYVDDIAEGILLAHNSVPKKNTKWNSKLPDPSYSYYPFKIYNVGSNTKINLIKYVKLIEKNLKKKAKIKFKPLQKGDVIHVSASINKIKNELGYRPTVNVEQGVKLFIDWYKSYYKKK